MTISAVNLCARLGASLVVLTTVQTPAFAETATPAAPRSIVGEFGFLIGDWVCRNTDAGKPEVVTARVRYEWAFGQQTLKETATLPGYVGEFFTTFDKRSNTFKGVAVDSFGGYVIWENQGLTNGRSSEVGYVFGEGKLKPVSRSELERVSETHYIIRDFQADTPAGRGSQTDTEDCVKQVA